jgi:LmbE family N-acetylglucosaminyl deacetylase
MNFDLCPSVWERVLVLAVHPDDESLGAGGLLQKAVERGGEVRVIFVTDGDNNPWPQRFIERRWRIGVAERSRWGICRQGEARAALQCLGVGAENGSFWHYPDQGITKILVENREPLIQRLVEEIQEWRPTLLIGPSPLDLHPDHNTLAVLLRLALSRLDPRRAPDLTLLQYVIHGGGLQFSNERRVQLELTAEQQKRKHRAIRCHATQMALSSRRFLAFARKTESFLVSGGPQVCVPMSAIGDSKPGKVSRPSVCCVIPCYNLASVCGPIVREAAHYARWVIAVNDGSTDDTGRVLHGAARECDGRVRVLDFPVNRGKGWALLEAFRQALDQFPFEVLITLDGDGQHQPTDIPRLAGASIESGADLVLGERLNHDAMPWRSRLGNRITARILRWLYPAAPIDTQSGLRALNREFVGETVRVLRGGRYETELQMLLLALEQRRGVRTRTISTLYFNGNELSHFRPLLDSWRIYRALWHWRRMEPSWSIKAEIHA